LIEILPMKGKSTSKEKSERTFIDTNVLVYVEARDLPTKQQAAIRALKLLYEAGTGVLSTQVLQEYCNVALKKLNLSPDHVREQLALFEQFEVVQVTPTIIRLGVDLHQVRKLSFYDAIIVASAQVSGCTRLFSEDMNWGEQIGGLKIVNPLGR
jgi:predicted nucleic acid-binding protein